jgi:hypothetical protein
MLNHGTTLVQLLHCISSNQLFNPLHSCFLSISKGDQVRHHLWLSNVLERISRPGCETLYATNTSQRKQERFFMNILSIESFCPQKMHKRTLLFGSICLKHGLHFDYWNQPLNMRMRVCYLDYQEVCLWYTQKTYYLHCSCFTPICDLFTDSL